MKRFLVCTILAGAFATGTAAAHQCAVSEVRAEGRAQTTTPGLRFVIVQIHTTQVCNQGDPTVLTETGLLQVIEDGVEVCTRTDVDVSVDPFGFGIGLHMDPADTGDCAVGVSMASLENPSLPFPEESGPQGGSLVVATAKSVVAEHNPSEGAIHGLRWDDELHAIADPQALFVRKLVTTVVAD